MKQKAGAVILLGLSVLLPLFLACNVVLSTPQELWGLPPFLELNFAYEGTIARNLTSYRLLYWGLSFYFITPALLGFLAGKLWFCRKS